ncbi:hypothetical protein Pmani_028672, partial [Petrolisthes manimaculis]
MVEERGNGRGGEEREEGKGGGKEVVRKEKEKVEER